MNNLNFTGTGTYLNIDQKQMADILRTTQVRWGFEISDGDRPADPIISHKAAPTVRVIKDQSLMRRPIAIPIGSIISGVPIMSNLFYQSSLMNSAGLTSGWYAPVPVSGDATANGMNAGYVANGIGHNGSALQSPIEDSIEGYGKLNLAAVLANGGTTVSDPYHAYDIADSSGAYFDETPRLDVLGNAVTTNSRFVRPANVPIGVVTEDIYVDDQGKFLNFTSNTMQKFRSFVTDWYVEVPYVVQEYDSNLATPSNSNWSTGGSPKAGYNAINALGMPVLFVPTLANLIQGIGGMVKSDITGKYLLDMTSFPNTPTTAQHIARLTAVDNKFPKDLTELIMVVKDTGVGGTDTFGLPFRLFLLANTILKNLVSPVASPTYAQILDLVQSGYIGVARLNLHVS
jgi:hypothetical protein